jgi:hypothetical protein
MTRAWICTRVAAGLALLAFCGCGGPTNQYKPVAEIPHAHDEHDHHGHEHAVGPHHGSVVELGEEEFHAEIVVDDKSHALRIYLLGPDAKTDATTTAGNLTLVLNDTPPLTLKGVSGAAEGQFSTFELIDEKVVHEITEAGYIHGTLICKIGEKNYSVDLDIHFDGDHSMHEGEAKPAESAAPAQP